MSRCDQFNGDAAIVRTDDGPHWLNADAGIHVSDELISDDLILSKYEIVEPCRSRYAHFYHARLRQQP